MVAEAPARRPRKSVRQDSANSRIAKLEAEIRQLRMDGALTNSLTGLGAQGFDPRVSTTIQAGRHLSKAEIDNLMQYEYGCAKHVRGLPNSAVRKWMRVDIESEEEDASKRVMDRLEDWGLRESVRQALILERQYGGSALIIGADDGGSYEDELNVEAVKDVFFLHPVSKEKLTVTGYQDLDKDKLSPRFGLPTHYQLGDSNSGVPAGRIHYSRLLIFQGESPCERKNRYDWGVSVLDEFWPSWREYSSSLAYGNGIGARLNETRLKIKGLAQMMKSNQWEEIRAMVQEIASVRSTFRFLLVDADDLVEDADLAFSGAGDLIKINRENVAAASGLSLQNFFGLAREGMSDNDESGGERDDAAIAAYQRDRLLQPINRMVEIALAVEKLSPDTPWQVKFLPLREEKPEAEAARRNVEATTSKTYVDMGALHKDEIREGLRADQDSPYQIQDGSVREAFGEADLEAQKEQMEMQQKMAPEPKLGASPFEKKPSPFAKEDAFDPGQPRGGDGKWSKVGDSKRGRKIASRVAKALEVTEAARTLVKEGVLDRAFISDVVEKTGISKEELLDLHRSGLVDLHRLDLVPVANQQGKGHKVDASSIRYLNAEFHLVEPNLRAPWQRAGDDNDD